MTKFEKRMLKQLLDLLLQQTYTAAHIAGMSSKDPQDESLKITSEFADGDRLETLKNLRSFLRRIKAT